MPRSVTLTLLAVGLFLVLLPLALGKPGLPPALKADEAAYYLMAESLVHDRDLRFGTEDSERLFHDFHFRPARNVILLSDDGWSTARYGKPLIYPLLAAPWVALFGSNGMVSFNALLLVGLLLLGTRYLARYNEPWLAALFASGFFLASTLFAYVFWLQPEMLNAFCVGAALYLGLPIHESDKPDSPRLAGDSARAVRSPGIPRLVLSGVLLAIAIYNKPMLVVLALPIVGAPLLRGRRPLERLRPALAWGAGCALALGVMALLSVALLGHPTPYLGAQARQGVTLCGPGEMPAGVVAARAEVERAAVAESQDPAPADPPPEPVEQVAPEPASSNSFGWLMRVPEIHWGKLVENVGYFLWGRHTGLLPYFPFVGLALLLYLRFSRTLERGLLLLALLAIAAFFLVFIAWNWHGGGGFVGNRYYVNAIPGFLFLVTAIRPAWLATLGFAASGLLLGPMLLTPFGSGVPEPTLQSHTRDFPLRELPLELSLRNVPGYHTVPLGELRIVGRQDQWLPQGPSLLVAGADRVELLLLSLEPQLEETVISVESPAGGRVRIDLGGDAQVLDMQPGETRQVTLHPGRAGRRYSPTNVLWWVAKLTVEAEGGKLLPWTRHFPPSECSQFAYNPRIEETFYTGAVLRLLGPRAFLERDLYAARWEEVEVPDRVVAGERFVVRARVLNASAASWQGFGSAQVHLTYRWLDGNGEQVAPEGLRTALPREVGAGDRVEVEMDVDAPKQAGAYTLELEPVLEFVAWFSARDPGSVRRVAVEVEER
jgi:hypothetical protein